MSNTAQAAKPSATDESIDKLCVDTIRTLSMDAVQKANSGHPGTPMSLAPVAYTLWQRFLRYDPEDPAWPNRDRFVLSNGHASMLLYSLLHLAGVKKDGKPAISLDDIKLFRQLDSKTPGHPEYGLTVGVETTTGPLGQGCGNSVGMAIAAGWLAKHFNRPECDVFDYDVYAFCRDGDLMEGIGSEAASLAGHLKLPNLCWIYDANQGSTLDGPADPGHSAKTSPCAFVLTVGMLPTLEMPMTSTRCREHLRDFSQLKIVQPSSSSPAISATALLISRTTNAAHGEPLWGRGRSPSCKEVLWLAGRRLLPRCRMVCSRNFREGIGQTRPRTEFLLEEYGPTFLRNTPSNSPNWRTTFQSHAAKAICRTGGTRICRRFQPIPRAWPRAKAPAKY